MRQDKLLRHSWLTIEYVVQLYKLSISRQIQDAPKVVVHLRVAHRRRDIRGCFPPCLQTTAADRGFVKLAILLLPASRCRRMSEGYMELLTYMQGAVPADRLRPLQKPHLPRRACSFHNLAVGQAPTQISSAVHEDCCKLCTPSSTPVSSAGQVVLGARGQLVIEAQTEMASACTAANPRGSLRRGNAWC